MAGIRPAADEPGPGAIEEVVLEEGPVVGDLDDPTAGIERSADGGEVVSHGCAADDRDGAVDARDRPPRPVGERGRFDVRRVRRLGRAGSARSAGSTQVGRGGAATTGVVVRGTISGWSGGRVTGVVTTGGGGASRGPPCPSSVGELRTTASCADGARNWKTPNPISAIASPRIAPEAIHVDSGSSPDDARGIGRAPARAKIPSSSAAMRGGHALPAAQGRSVVLERREHGERDLGRGLLRIGAGWLRGSLSRT